MIMIMAMVTPDSLPVGRDRSITETGDPLDVTVKDLALLTNPYQHEREQPALQ